MFIQIEGNPIFQSVITRSWFLYIDLFMVYWTQYIDEVRWAMELKWYMATWSFSESYSQQHFAKILWCKGSFIKSTWYSCSHIFEYADYPSNKRCGGSFELFLLFFSWTYPHFSNICVPLGPLKRLKPIS